MTVGAAPVKEKPRIGVSRRGRMSLRHMALSAKPGIADFEQPVVNRAVRLMAIGTILESRRMLPEEWPAPLSVAGVTVLVDACLFELGGIWTAVRIVTVRAGHLALAQRHVRRAHELRFPLQVTLPAHFSLGSFVEERRFVSDFRQLIAVGGFLHQGMAVYAGYPSARMRTCFPVGLNSALMASETGFILNFS
jgi:hypothetical protein